MIKIITKECSVEKQHIAKVFGISVSVLTSKIKNGELISPSGNHSTYTNKDLDTLCTQLGQPVVKLLNTGKEYFEDTLKCNFMIVDGGVFLVSPSAKKQGDVLLIKCFKNLIKRYGVVSAQSLNNHVHINDCGTDNPVHHFLLAKQILENWASKAKKLKYCGTLVIDISELTNTTISIYILPTPP